MLRIEPYSEGLRQRIWWGAGSDATAEWAGRMGMNLMSSTLKDDESGEPLHVQQTRQIQKFRQEFAQHHHGFEPRVSVSRSIIPIVNDQDRAYFLGQRDSEDKFGMIDEKTRAVFGRSYTAEPDQLVTALAEDTAVAEADTLLVTVPNQLGVEYNAHVLESIMEHVAKPLGWK